MATPSSPPQIFAPRRRNAVRQRMHALQRSRPDAADYLFADVAEDIGERCGFLRHAPARALVVGDPSGQVAEAVTALGATVVRADPAGAPHAAALDLERPWPEGGFDLIVLAFVLDTANDLPGALIHARNALADGGLMLATLLGAGSLPALRAIMLAADADRPAPRIHPQVDVRAGAQLLQRAGFADPVADSRGLDVRFSTFSALLTDLRAQGLGNALALGGPALGKVALARAQAAYGEHADEAGRLVEHFELLTLSGWRR